MSLAARGDQRSLNIHLQDMITADGRTDTYSKAGALDLFIYAMGKAVGKSLGRHGVCIVEGSKIKTIKNVPHHL